MVPGPTVAGDGGADGAGVLNCPGTARRPATVGI